MYNKFIWTMLLLLGIMSFAAYILIFKPFTAKAVNLNTDFSITVCHHTPANQVSLHFNTLQAYLGHLGTPHSWKTYDTNGACPSVSPSPSASPLVSPSPSPSFNPCDGDCIEPSPSPSNSPVIPDSSPSPRASQTSNTGPEGNVPPPALVDYNQCTYRDCSVVNNSGQPLQPPSQSGK